MKKLLGDIWFFMVHIFLHCVFTVFCGLKVTGRENLKIKGAFILAGNHTSFMDPPLFGAVSSRRINCIAQSDLWDVPLLGPVMSSLGAFPVDRQNPDSSTIKKAVAILKSGEPVGIFPEGRRVLVEEEEGTKAERGVGLIAKMSGVPIVPFSIIGGKECITLKGWIPHFKKAAVIIGKPIVYEKGKFSANEKENMQLFADHLLDLIIAPVKAAKEEAKRKAAEKEKQTKE